MTFDLRFFWCLVGLLVAWLTVDFFGLADAQETKRQASVLASEASRGPTGKISAHVGVWSSDNGESAQGELTLDGVSEGSDYVPNVSDLGDVEWRFDGQRVSGILTRDGNKVGVFEGQKDPSGVKGVFSMLDGRKWEWSWSDTTENRSSVDVDAQTENRE